MKQFFATFIGCFAVILLFAQSSKTLKSGGSIQTQLANAYSQAKQMGLSDKEISNQLIKRGFTAQMIEETKKLVQTRGSFSGATSLSPSSDTSIDNQQMKRDTNWVFQTPFTKPISPYFGYSFFTNAFFDYSPNTNLATPEQYIVGPGDQLVISITGLNTKSFTGYINSEGQFNLPYAGVIQLSGLPIEGVRKLVTEKLSTIYPGLKTKATSLYLNLGELRSIQVIVSGEAAHPGGYVVSSLTNFFNLLYISGGPTERGGLRKIQLIRNNKVIEEIDLYQYLADGLVRKNIRLEDQDIIHFPMYQQRVSLTGEVKNPFIFELKEKESLENLLHYAGGFSEKAYDQSITVTTNGDNFLLVKNVTKKDFSKYILQSGDAVNVGAIDQRFENRVTLQGEINRPGPYGLLQEEGLKSLIARAGGIKDEAFVNRGYIQRKMPGLSVQMIPFDLKQIIGGLQEDILLVKNDSIIIYPASNFIATSFITVNGGVKNPGSYSFQKGMKAEDLIALAGGFTVDAAYHKIELSRMEKNISDNLANQVLRLSTIKIDSNLVSSKNSVKLEPFDDIFVPRLLNYRLIGNVKLRGEILYQGDYSLEKRDETVLEIVKRAGGISPFASIRDLQIYRGGLRVGTNIFGINNEIEKDISFFLLPGDSIFIPRKSNFVTVSGAVFNEQMVDYKSANLISYISAVGGVKNNGNLKKVYVQYPNGMFKKMKHFLFFRSYPKIIAGSKIIIPEKTLLDVKKFGVGEISGAATLAATLLTSMIAVYSVLKR